jgi:hypothetical protein
VGWKKRFFALLHCWRNPFKVKPFISRPFLQFLNVSSAQRQNFEKGTVKERQKDRQKEKQKYRR